MKNAETSALLFCTKSETVDQARELLKSLSEDEINSLRNTTATLFWMCYQELRSRKVEEVKAWTINK